MPTKDKAHTENETRTTNREPNPALENLNVIQQQTHPGTIVQRAGLDPNSLTSSDVMQLQRTVGNQAVGRLLAQRAQHQPKKRDSDKSVEVEKRGGLQGIADTAGRKIVQRNEESTGTLKGMVEPKVGQQDIEVAQGIQGALEKIYMEEMKIEEMEYIDKANFNSAVCLGGIELPPLQRFENVSDLIEACNFVNLGKGSVGRGIYQLLNEELKRKIVRNTLTTMDDAKQLDYLRQSDFAGEGQSGWKVVIEVHYYRERPTTNNVFHKDTLGSTLFVNLNYLNSEKLVGPEYVVNPMENEQHMSQIAESLPKEFLQDRKSVMDEMDEPKIIEVVEVPEYGYVAFVDETIHHSSPTTEHRKVKGSDIHIYLRAENEEKYDAYKSAYVKWSNQWTGFWDYEDYLPEGGGFDGEDWLSVFKNIEDGNTKYDRNQIRSIDYEQRVLSDNDIDKLVHSGGYDNFGEASIPKVTTGKSKMTKDDRPLKRRMSMNLTKNKGVSEKKESGGKRSFFRTWVRAEKVEKNVIKPDWKWDQKRD